MLVDDVASNKAIGAYGAELILNQSKHKERISVLTHCNTGR
jgi:methylthioribose-1-phosphate isomerase